MTRMVENEINVSHTARAIIRYLFFSHLDSTQEHCHLLSIYVPVFFSHNFKYIIEWKHPKGIIIM